MKSLLLPRSLTRSTRPALTLLELLVVMSIIILVLAIMVPPMFHFIKYVQHLGK